MRENMAGNKLTGTITNKQGLALRTVRWAPSDAQLAAVEGKTDEVGKRILFFVHGHGAHLEFELLRIPRAWCRAGVRGVLGRVFQRAGYPRLWH